MAATASVRAFLDVMVEIPVRYYWDVEEDDCIVNQVDAVIRYGYEYQGATTRLVITPLTDR